MTAAGGMRNGGHLEVGMALEIVKSAFRSSDHVWVYIALVAAVL